jgi:hypothetical protein
MTIYRYLRPLRFNQRDLKADIQPRGGVCLLLEPLGDDRYTLSWSICHRHDTFNRDVAKVIAAEGKRRRKSR